MQLDYRYLKTMTLISLYSRTLLYGVFSNWVPSSSEGISRALEIAVIWEVNWPSTLKEVIYARSLSFYL